MNCVICGSPYTVTTDCRCKNCINKIQKFVYPITHKTSSQEEGLTNEEERRFYDILLWRKHYDK